MRFWAVNNTVMEYGCKDFLSKTFFGIAVDRFLGD